MNFIKTCFNSFFRTLGRILCYVAIGMILSFLFSKIDVHADSLPMKVSLNGDYSRQTWFQNGRNMTMSIFSDYSEDQVMYDITQAPIYGYVMMCSDATIPSYYSSNPNNITNVKVQDTKIPCQQGTMTGRIQYVLFNTPQWSCSVQGSNCVFGYSLVFYQNATSNYYIIESQFVDTQVSVDLSTGYLIDQNNTIINQNTTIINQNNSTNSKLDQAENTRKGIWETIKGIPESIANLIKGLFIPDNFDFLNDFKETLSNKLGFIAEVPIKLLDFIISLADFTWTEFSSITFPKIEIMGVSFWNDITIDVGPILGGLKKYRYITDVLCVTLCVNTLRKMYDKFNGGSGE